MPKRSVGVYPDENGEILVSFEKGQKGVPLKSLIPEAVRGEKFGDFDVRGYFSLAQMILVTPEDLQVFTQALNFKGASKSKPNKGTLPPINPAGLALCQPNGDLDPERTAELFQVVTAYWEYKDEMAIELGYVAAMWKRANNAEVVITFIKDNTRKHPKTGELELVFPEMPPEGKLISSLLPLDVPLKDITKPMLENLVEWLSSVPRGEKGFGDRRRKVADIAFLGLADFFGEMDHIAITAARDYIWKQIDQPDFKALWRHIQTVKGTYPVQDPEADYNAYNASIAELFDQNVRNVEISETVLKLAKSGVAVPTGHLAFAAWILWQMGRSGQYGFELQEIFNKSSANWLASEAANEFLNEVFPNEANAALPRHPKTGRNDPCPCGSGKKYKKCCGR